MQALSSSTDDLTGASSRRFFGVKSTKAVCSGASKRTGKLVGVMGIQPVRDVTLIRHAHVRTSSQKKGIGGDLLSHLRDVAKSPVLIGTWADAVWAIRFYEKHGFRMVDPQGRDRLAKQYWTVSKRPMEVSVVLADQKWWDLSRLTYVQSKCVADD